MLTQANNSIKVFVEFFEIVLIFVVWNQNQYSISAFFEPGIKEKGNFVVSDHNFGLFLLVWFF